MARAKTGAERYIAEQKRDPEFRRAHDEAARRIRQVDELVRTLDDAREEHGLSKAELARRAGMAPEAVRRLFTADGVNPTAGTLIALADVLDVEVIARPVRRRVG
jgi:ribosome-binding protein aMBF1 (putative translation factor)